MAEANAEKETFPEDSFISQVNYHCTVCKLLVLSILVIIKNFVQVFCRTKLKMWGVQKLIVTLIDCF